MKKIDFNETLQEFSNPITGELSQASEPSIKDICEIVKPSSILELGFNRGSSAYMWLNFSNANLLSLDIRNYQDVEDSIKILNKKFPNRFNYLQLDHETLPNHQERFKNKFDLAFIDGDHSYDAMKRDAKNILSLGIKNIVFDDYIHPYHGNDVKLIIKELNLAVIKEYNNTSCGHVLTKVR